MEFIRDQLRISLILLAKRLFISRVVKMIGQFEVGNQFVAMAGS